MDISPKWGDWGKCSTPYFLTRVLPNTCLPAFDINGWIIFHPHPKPGKFARIIWVLPDNWMNLRLGGGAQMNRAGCCGFTVPLLRPESLEAILDLFLFPLMSLLTISRGWLKWILLFSVMSTVWHNKAPVLNGLVPLNASAMLTVSKVVSLFASCNQMAMPVSASELMNTDFMYFLR